MTKVLAFLVGGILAGACFYVLELVLNTVATILIETVDSYPTPDILQYGTDVAILVAAILALYVWIYIYRAILRPKLI